MHMLKGRKNISTVAIELGSVSCCNKCKAWPCKLVKVPTELGSISWYNTIGPSSATWYHMWGHIQDRAMSRCRVKYLTEKQIMPPASIHAFSWLITMTQHEKTCRRCTATPYQASQSMNILTAPATMNPRYPWDLTPANFLPCANPGETRAHHLGSHQLSILAQYTKYAGDPNHSLTRNDPT